MGQDKKTGYVHTHLECEVNLSLCLTKHHVMENYWRSGGIPPRILDLRTRRRWVVSFTSRPLYTPGKSPWYPLDRRLGGPRPFLNTVVKKRIPSPRRKLNPRTPIDQPGASSLYRLNYRGSHQYPLIFSSAHAANYFFTLPPRPDRLWIPPSILSNWYRGSSYSSLGSTALS
jgi:hypothetical protein